MESEIPGMYKLITPVQRWIPEGSGGRYIDCPRYISVEKTGIDLRFDEAELIFKKSTPKQRHIASGEWSAINRALQKENPELEMKMVTGPSYERTGTLLFYPENGREDGYHDGFLIDIPLVDDKGMILTDEKGIPKGRYVFEMALPIKSMSFKRMGRNLSKFANTVHGMENAVENIPVHAYFN